MKSLKNKISNFYVVSVFLFIISLVIFIAFSYFGTVVNRSENISSIVLKDVNSVISILYKAENNNDFENQVLNNPQYYEYKNKIIDNLKKLHYDFSIVENNNAKELIDEYANSARYINNLADKNIVSMKNFSIIVLVILMTLFALMMLIMFNIKNFTMKFIENIENGIQKINYFLDFNNKKVELKAKWYEEEEFVENIKTIEDRLIFNRRLLNMRNFGTLENFLPELKKIIASFIPLDRIALAFLDGDNLIAESAYTNLDNIFLNVGFTESINKTTLKNMLENKKTYRIINDLQEHYNSKNKSVSTSLLLKEGIQSSITIPLYFEEKCYGFFFISSKEKNIYKQKHAVFARNIINMVKQNLFNHYISQEIIASTANGFVKLLEGKDNETGNHIVRVSHYAKIIATKLCKTNKKLNPKFIREIYWFAPLHDIGKVGIPDKILLKPAKLTKEEFDIMKTHVNIGESIIKDMSDNIKFDGNMLLKTAGDIIVGHHEKYDGSGYPYGLKGDKIPLAGRIVAVADVFDALTSARPYKVPFSFEDSLEMVKQSSGTHFDPKVVNAFISSLDEVKEIYEKYKD